VVAETKKYGFIAKPVFYSTWEGAEFLRGWFLPGTRGGRLVPLWFPLPGQALKLGKFRAREGAFMTPEEFAGNIACAYDWIPAEYPVLGPMVAFYRKVGERSGVTITTLRNVIESYDYKMLWRSDSDLPAAEAEGAKAEMRESLASDYSRAALDGLLAERYGPTGREQILALHSFLGRKAKKLGAVVLHPAAPYLAVDYGWDPKKDQSTEVYGME
jgi:hypothetical protein